MERLKEIGIRPDLMKIFFAFKKKKHSNLFLNSVYWQETNSKMLREKDIGKNWKVLVV